MLDIILENFWVLLVISVITGAWTGYITNDIAIKMLFKEYGFGKFKLGGVIIRSRGKLEKNLGDLVEREIINDQTIRKQLNKPEVKETIRVVVNEFLQDKLYFYFEDNNLYKLEGYENTRENILRFINDYMNENIAEIIVKITEELKITTLTSAEQINQVTNLLTDEVLKVIEDEKIIASIITSFYEKNNHLNLKEFLGDEVYNIIIENLEEVFNDLFEQLKFKYPRQVEMLIKKIYRDLDLQKIVSNLEVDLKSRYVKEFISTQNINDIANLIDEYINSSKSEEAVNVLCEGVIVALKNINKPIIELFTGDLREVIEDFLEEQLPNIIDKLIEMVRKNKGDIEELIESSIDETISDQGAFKRAILSGIRVFLLENFTQKYDIIDKMIEMLENIDVEDVSNTISNQIVTILHEKNIADIVLGLEENDFLSPEMLGKQIHKSMIYISNNTLAKDRDYKDFLNLEIGELLKFDFEKIINQSTVSFISKQIIYNKNIFNLSKRKLIEFINNYIDRPVNTFLKADLIASTAENIDRSIVGHARVNLDSLKLKLSAAVYENLKGRNIADLLNKETLSINSQVLSDVVLSSVEKVLDQYKKVKVHEIFDSLNSIDDLSENVLDSILEFLDRGLETLLTGNVSKVVEDNIKQFDNDQVLEMMEDFMGKKLKPLTIIGAILGGFVGLGLAFTDLGMVNYFMTIPIYALVGYLTNVMAIFFIFRPYKPFLGIKQIQGIIVRQVPVFAQSMGRVVQNNLLSKEIVSNTFANQEQEIKLQFSNFLQQDNYRIVRELMLDKSPDFSEQLQEFINTNINKNKRKLTDQITDEIMNFDLSNINKHMVSEFIAELISNNVNFYNTLIADQIKNAFKTDKTLNQVITNMNESNVEEIIDNIIEVEINKLKDKLKNPNYISKKIYEYRHKVDVIFDKSLNEVFNDSIRENIEIQIQQTIYDNLFTTSGQNSISDMVSEKLHEIFANSKTIDDIFGGRFIPIINENMASILMKIGFKVNDWIQFNKVNIYITVRDKVREQMNVFLTMGYSVMSGDKLVQETVYCLVDDKIPAFINNRISSLNEEVARFFSTLGEVDLESINVEFQEEGINNYIKQVFSSEEIHLKTNRFVSVTLDYFYGIEASRFFGLFQIYSIHDLLLMFDEELKIFNTGLYNQIDTNQDQVVYNIRLFINQFLTREILTTRVRNLTLGIEKEHLIPVVDRSITLLQEDKFMNNGIYNLTLDVVNNISELPVNEILNHKYLRSDIYDTIASINSNYQLRDKATEILTGITTELANELPNIFDDEMKNLVVYALVNSVYDVLEGNIADLLNAVDLKEVTVNEINKMEPEKIKELFDSFAGKYFRRLETYGVMGGIFAFQPIAIIALAYYSVNSIKKQVLHS